MQIVRCTLVIDTLGLIWSRTKSFSQKIRIFIPPDNTQRTTSELPDVGGKLGAWMIKIFHNFYFPQFDVVFRIVNFFSGIFDAISSEKSCPTFMLYLLTYI